MSDGPVADDAVRPATFDDVVHQPTRLGILVLLSESRRADFTYIKSALGLTDGNLGRHLEILAAGKLVKITKRFEDRRPRTWVQITRRGDAALAEELSAMKAMIDRVEGRRPTGARRAVEAT